MINYLDLKYFVDIVDFGSISSAARYNYIAQQSMSAHLKKIEKYYGCELFSRSSPMYMTDAGEKVYKASKVIPPHTYSLYFRHNQVLSPGAEKFIRATKEFLAQREQN